MGTSAPTLTRILAFSSDLIFILFITICMMIVTEAYVVSIFSHIKPISQDLVNFTAEVTFLFQLSLIPIVMVSYFTISLYMSNGLTVGKSLFNLQVVPLNSKYISLKQCLLRSLGYTCCYFSAGTLFMANLLRDDSKGLADLISQTQSIPTSVDQESDIIYLSSVSEEKEAA